MQYTPVRFLSSIILALWVERAYRSGKNLFLVFSIAGVGATLVLLFSPDQGIQFMIGTLLYFTLCQRNPRKGLYPALILFCLFSVAAVALGWRLGEFKYFVRIGGGALNFPLLFSLTSVIVLLYVVFAGAIAIAAYRNKQLDHPLIYLLALALITMPPAMGRCDPGHIFINTIGAALAVMVVFAQHKVFSVWVRFPLLVCWPSFTSRRYGQIKRSQCHFRRWLRSLSVILKLLVSTNGWRCECTGRWSQAKEFARCTLSLTFLKENGFPMEQRCSHLWDRVSASIPRSAAYEFSPAVIQEACSRPITFPKKKSETCSAIQRVLFSWLRTGKGDALLIQRTCARR